jgi:predicted esterase
MGMIVCYPEYKGTYNRHITNKYGTRYKELPVRFKGERIATFIDLRRTVDYLMTRQDVDGEGLLYYGFSWGAISGPISLAVEPRFKAGILVSGGYWEWEKQVQPEIASSQFARHVKQPVLMINGIHDGLFPLRESQLPLYDDFQHPLKAHAVLLHGHTLPADSIRDELEPWLERVFASDQVHAEHEE